jgi:iron complex transport system substrate-binding protein
MIVMRRWLNIFIAVGIGAALVGCEATAVTVGGEPNPKPITNMVSLAPSTTEIVASLSFSGALRGRTESDDYPPSVASVPVVASVKPDYEKIAVVKPELIVYDADLYSPSDIEKIKAAAPMTIGFESRNLDDFAKELYKLGSTIGAESAASSYVDKIRAARGVALADSSGNKPKGALIMVGSGTEHMIAGTDSFYADMLRSSGAEVVGPKADKFVPLSPEMLVQGNPDVIVVGFHFDQKDKDGNNTRALAAANAILRDPRFKTVTAVQKRQIIPIDENTMVRRGFRVDRFIDDVRKRIDVFQSR